MLEYQDLYIITILIKKDKDEKNIGIIDKIKEIYYENKGRYGYRRITLELKNQGFNITILIEILKQQLQTKNGLQM